MTPIKQTLKLKPVLKRKHIPVLSAYTALSQHTGFSERP